MGEVITDEGTLNMDSINSKTSAKPIRKITTLIRKIAVLDKELKSLRMQRNDLIMKDFANSGLTKNQSAFSRKYADRYGIKPGGLILVVRKRLGEADRSREITVMALTTVQPNNKLVKFRKDAWREYVRENLYSSRRKSPA